MPAPRIYLYFKSFPPKADSFRAGMDKAIHGLARGLVSNGADVTVLCENLDDGVTVTPFGYTVRCFKWVKKGPTPKLAPALVKFIPEMAGGLVQLNAMFHPSVASLAKRLRANGIRYVVAPHDPYHPNIFAKNPWIKWPYWYLFERPMLRKAAAIQLLDARHATYLRDLKVLAQTVAAPNGYDPDEVPDESTLKFSHNGSARFVFLGRFDNANKGIDLLIDAFARLDPKSGATLTLQGPDGGDRSALEARAKQLGLDGRIEFKLPDYTKSSSTILADYDVFCLTSRFEGFSMAALEGVLAARVVLVSDVAGFSPFVTAWNCGQVVRADVDSVHRGLVNLLEHRSEWEVMGLSGRLNAIEHLRWDRIASELLLGYQRLLIS